jgi:hypothetical protein
VTHESQSQFIIGSGERWMGEVLLSRRPPARAYVFDDGFLTIHACKIQPGKFRHSGWQAEVSIACLSLEIN